MLKKNLLLIFGLLGFVSLMAEGGPKKTNLLSKLGLGSNPTCCDPSECCPDLEANCCNLSTCSTPVGNCCAPVSCCDLAACCPEDDASFCDMSNYYTATSNCCSSANSCCTSSETDQKTTSTAGSKVSQSVAQS